LQAQDSKKPINLYINSPGGVISSGLAIYDTMQYLECEIHTYCIGMAASLGALLLCAGAKGKRFALPHSRIMIHQPHGGVGGSSADIERQAQEIIRLKDTLSRIISFHSNHPLERIIEDSDRDFYLSAEEARVYGLIDQVVQSKKHTPKL
jgi:ATP-dependent Clp protease protease subunit